ncbi:MAG: polyribonucleotide nucleotidyltransferase [Puniceicoccales bacterium]|jgi:polyribonucleotide nucleotidyltransferase|nr:polyribonucleotide nucleotidyltransferase [Puniceicoccales bacterium]
MNQKYSVTIPELGITIATGSIARQANGSVTISKGETTVFVSATAAEGLRSPDQDFFPLTVDYREKFAAAGRFPGGYFKREGKPSEKEILTSRLCDRPLRPLFQDGFLNEVQVIGLLLSTDLQNEPDILMVNGASAALLCSDIPWNGPIAAVRIGQIGDQFVVNPTNEQMQSTTLDLIYVGNERDMMMIEGSADQIPDERFIEALEFAHNAIQPILAAQRHLASQYAKAKREYALVVADPTVFDICQEIANNDKALAKAVYQEKKQDREKAVSAVKADALAAATAKLGEGKFDPRHINIAFEKLQEKVYRETILNEGRRADGRSPQDLRPISAQVDVLPRVHGSAIFQRGETQGLVIATLGTSKDSQELDGLTGGPKSKTFILHYNFPPFSVGECGRFGAPGRREIGHGALAERSLLPVLPAEDAFPYSIRLSSEIMESNGSTSMASVCGGTLALMDAGVPITAPVAGISCGLVTEEKDGAIQRHIILTDIIGAEDHFGDMDFKICGTTNGITGFQLDLKIHGLPIAIAREAIQQNKIARDKILAILATAKPEPSATIKESAPRIHPMQIPPDKIGALIGPGGKNIKRITEFCNVQIDINEDDSGRLLVFATNADALQRAIHEINIITAQIEIGKTYKGIVRSIKDFGCFVECLPGQEGLVHVSELADFRVNNVEDVCKLGDEIIVKCIGVEEKTGKVRLSRRAAIAEKEGRPYEPKPRSDGGDRGGRFGDRDRRGGRGFDRDRRGHDRGDRGDRGDRHNDNRNFDGGHGENAPSE